MLFDSFLSLVWDGSILCRFVEAYSVTQQCTARKMSELNPSLKMPEESLRKLLGQLRSVQARKHRTTDAFIVGAVTKRHRDLLDLLGIEKLPGYLNR